MLPAGIPKQLLHRWCVGFFFGNAMLFWLIGLQYLSTSPWAYVGSMPFLQQIFFIIFLTLSYFAQLSFIAFLPYFLLLPIILIFPQRRLVVTIAILSITLLTLWFTIDGILYNLYRFHVNSIMLSLAFRGMGENVFGFSVEEMFLVIFFIGFVLLLETYYARWLWRKVSTGRPLFPFLKWFSVILISTIYLSYSIIIYSTHYLQNRTLMDGARFLPLYFETLRILFPFKNDLTPVANLYEKYCLAENNPVPLQYPYASLLCEARPKPLNVVMIAIDTWRFDMLNAEVTPNIAAFAQNAWLFTQHLSGGNSTGPGIFSLFYSIPSTYWPAIEKQGLAPVFLDELQKHQYEMGVFSSADLMTPPFNRTVFKNIKNLYIGKQPGKTPAVRDRMVTTKFNNFLDYRTGLETPFFSFLFYDSAHSYCADTDNQGPFQPAAKKCVRFSLSNKRDTIKYLNRYKNALYSIDQQVGQVLQSLAAHQLLENTIVIITGDHGEEFDDNHLGYWGHSGNFTSYQVQTPLVVYFPHALPKVFTHETSHFDIVPTLLSRLFSCQNPIAHYSVGTNLENSLPRPFLIISSYTDFGVRENERTTTFFPTGYYSVAQRDGKVIPNISINKAQMDQVSQKLKQFYHV